MTTRLIIVMGIILVALVSAASYYLITSRGSQNQAITQEQQNATPKPNPFGIPANDAGEAEVNRWWQDLVARSVKTSTVSINECNPNPQFAYLTPGQALTLTNADDVEHVIELSETVFYAVPANGKLDITVDFGNGVGAYDYVCDDSEAAVGIFTVVAPTPTQ